MLHLIVCHKLTTGKTPAENLCWYRRKLSSFKDLLVLKICGGIFQKSVNIQERNREGKTMGAFVTGAYPLVSIVQSL